MDARPKVSNLPSWVPVARWQARILALLALGKILAFLFGEGVDAARLTPVAWLGVAAARDSRGSLPRVRVLRTRPPVTTRHSR